jgi:hypothetical protein
MGPELNIVGERTAELKLDTGCPLCAGPLYVRVSPEGSRGVCVPCHLILATVLRSGSAGLAIDFPPVAEA